MSRWELNDGRAAVGPLDEEHVLRMIAAGLPEATVVRREGAAEWQAIRSHAPFALGLAARSAQPAVPAHAPPMQAPPVRASRVYKSDFIGIGCLTQGLGVLCLIVGFAAGGMLGALLGAAVLFVCLVVGSNQSRYAVCGACSNRLASPDARMCPVCRAELLQGP